MSASVASAGSIVVDDGINYGKHVFLDIVRHSVLKSLDPKDMIKFLTARQEYELGVEEKCREAS